MSNTASFSNLFKVLGFNTATGTFTGAEHMPPTNTTITDDPSNNTAVGDGIETAGEELYWSADPSFATVTYTGFHINGDPIIRYQSDFGGAPIYYLLTNNSNSGADLPAGTAAAGNYTYCFVRGTHIATPDGERLVQDLVIGDLVLDHHSRAVQVQWIGRQTRSALAARLQGQLPVRIDAGALGDGLPRRDLFVSPDHALLVDGLLVHALALVNGRNIAQLSQWTGVLDYFHVETEAHEIILAEGSPAETFIDNVDRANFDNHAEYLALYPDAQPMTELGLPRVKFARQLPMAIRRRLDAIAAAAERAAA
jgi:hypothetical protein